MTASAPYAVKLALLGTLGGTHIGGSFARGAAKLGIQSIWFDADKASAGPRLLRSLSWHLADRRPLHLNQFSNELAKACARAKPEILVATGMAPLTESALRALRQLGIVSVNYSTDDPWNPTMRSDWHLRALPLYDLIFSPRRSNLDDFQRLGCPKVHYLPFGYDENLFAIAGAVRRYSRSRCSVRRGRRPRPGGVHDGIHASRTAGRVGWRLLGTVSGFSGIRVGHKTTRESFAP